MAGAFFLAAEPFDLLALAPEPPSPRTAARLSSSAAIRSGALVGSGSSLGVLTISLPSALRSSISSSSSRYSSRYLSASKSVESDSISCWAISSSRFSGFVGFSSNSSLRRSSGSVTSSAKRIVAIVSTSSIGRIAARCSLLRSTKRAIATLCASVIACDEQRVGLLGALVGAQVVGVLEVDGVDLVEVDEVLDLDRAGLLGVELGQLVAAQRHVLVGGELVALDDVVVGDLLAVGLGDALVAHAGAVLLAQLAEAHGLLRDRAVQLHGHVQQPEADLIRSKSL